MTKIIDLSEVVSINSENAIYSGKEIFKKEDLIIAQSDGIEKWYDIIEILNPPFLKTGYTMYILSTYVPSSKTN